MKITTLLLAATPLLPGCAVAPPRVDPLANTGTTTAIVSPYSAMTVALVYSENTKAAATYLRTANYGQFDPESVIPGIAGGFTGAFKKILKSETLADAKASGADAVLVFDYYADIAMNKFRPTKMDASAILMTTDGSPIDTVKAHAESYMSWTALTRVMGRTVDASEAELRDKLKDALLSSAKFQAYAASRGTAPAASAAATVVVARTLSSDIDSPSRRGAERPDDFALIIGIEDYQNLPKADYGVRDAETVRKHYEALGVPARNIIALEGSQATGSKLRSYLQQWLPRNVKPQSTVFVYYSGHGAPDPSSGDAYLVPWDADPMFLTTSAYPLKQFYAELAKLKAKRVLVALDACFSGSGGRSVLAKGARPLVAKVDESIPSAANLTVLAAASGTEITGSLDEQAHGLFTYYYLKGLASGAKTPRALFDYLKPKVQDDARRQNREQSPTLNGDGADAAF